MTKCCFVDVLRRFANGCFSPFYMMLSAVFLYTVQSTHQHYHTPLIVLAMVGIAMRKTEPVGSLLWGAKEIVKRLKVLIVLAKDAGLEPSTYLR